MGSKDRGKNSELDPANVNLGVESLCLHGAGSNRMLVGKVAADIVAPSAEQHVGGLRGKAGLEGQ